MPRKTEDQAPEPPFSDAELGTFQTLIDIVARLRAPGGCPWDREQTHDSLKRNLLEESHEVIEAIDGGDPAILSEELGDLIVQVAFHADIAQEAGEFQLEDVLRKINGKLVRRHPHVFAGGHAEDAREVSATGNRSKRRNGRPRGKANPPLRGFPAVFRLWPTPS